MAKQTIVGALGKALFDENKHKRGQGGKFASKGGAKAGPGKATGSVAQAHGIFDKLAGASNKEKLAAAQAVGINANTAKTQLYKWQKAQAAKALDGKANPTKADLQQAAAKALGVKPAAPKPTPAPLPPKPAIKKEYLSKASFDKKVDALAVHEEYDDQVWVENPIPLTDYEFPKGVNKKAQVAQEAQSWTAKRIKVKDLVTTQESVEAGNLKSLYGKPDSALSDAQKTPVVVAIGGGKYAIMDGNHRASKALLMGETEITVHELKIPNIPKI